MFRQHAPVRLRPGQVLDHVDAGPVEDTPPVIAPQLIRVTIPPLSNDFITMLKITSLASVISLQELLARTQSAVSVSYQFAEYYAAAAVWYLAIVSIFMAVQSQLERRFRWTSQARPAGGVVGGLRALGAR